MKLQILGPHPRTSESENPGVEPRIQRFNKPASVPTQPKHKNHWCRLHSLELQDSFCCCCCCFSDVLRRVRIYSHFIGLISRESTNQSLLQGSWGALFFRLPSCLFPPEAPTPTQTQGAPQSSLPTICQSHLSFLS